MATVICTLLVDDLNGSAEDVTTIGFDLEDTSYEIDLTATSQERLRDKLAKFFDAATPVRWARGLVVVSRDVGDTPGSQLTGIREDLLVRCEATKHHT